jgi:FkbM family methyltransferase
MSNLTQSLIGKFRFARQIIRHFGMAKGVQLLLRWKLGTGVFHLIPPGCDVPMALRARTSDLPMFLQTFIERQYAFTLHKEPTTIVDAGANIGTACCYFASRFPQARILALEPDPSNYAMLCRNTAHLPCVTALEAALWSRRGTLELVTVDRHKSQIEVREPAARTSTASVNCLSMEELLSEQNISFVDVLKVDVEGAEKDIFASAEQWIDSVGTIVIELHEAIAPGSTYSFTKATASFHHRRFCGENLIVSRDEK